MRRLGMCLKYTSDDLSGIAVPPNFAGMVMPSIDFVGYVWERRCEHEFQDVAPHPGTRAHPLALPASPKHNNAGHDNASKVGWNSNA